MLILTMRTDKPEAEIGLYENDQQLAYQVWSAHRQLAESLHNKIQTLLTSNNKQLTDLQGIACFAGPGSFTGLRIGLSVANALAYSLAIPIVAEQARDDADWRIVCIQKLIKGETNQVALPEYGAPVHITPPKSR